MPSHKRTRICWKTFSWVSSVSLCFTNSLEILCSKRKRKKKVSEHVFNLATRTTREPFNFTSKLSDKYSRQRTFNIKIRTLQESDLSEVESQTLGLGTHTLKNRYSSVASCYSCIAFLNFLCSFNICTKRFLINNEELYLQKQYVVLKEGMNAKHKYTIYPVPQLNKCNPTPTFGRQLSKKTHQWQVTLELLSPTLDVWKTRKKTKTKPFLQHWLVKTVQHCLFLLKWAADVHLISTPTTICRPHKTEKSELVPVLVQLVPASLTLSREFP